MELNKLAKTTAKSKKRVGRGFGSGKGGHTSGRGQKGQKSRDQVKLMFEGTKMRKSLIKRLPMMRGKLRFKSIRKDPIVLNVKYLNLLKDKTEVTVDTLIKNGLVGKEAKQVGVKILGEGDLQKSLIVSLPVSKGAKKKIEKAGGKVVEAPKVSSAFSAKKADSADKEVAEVEQTSDKKKVTLKTLNPPSGGQKTLKATSARSKKFSASVLPKKHPKSKKVTKKIENKKLGN